MKKIKVKPVEQIEFELEDKTFLCSFNMLSMAYMQEAVSKLEGRLDEIPTAHLVSLMLYSGIKANDETFTVEEANALAMVLDPGCYGEIISSYENAVMSSIGEDEKNSVKKAMARYLASVRKSTSE